MQVLVIGSGGREHALARKLADSPSVHGVFVAPGNAGTAECGRNIPISVTDLVGLTDFARQNHVDVTIVGPEIPLVEGIVDRFESEGLGVVGPTAAAAQLEGSKEFAKDFMRRHGIPTAAHKTFGRADLDEAFEWVESNPGPCVVKADGLAAGKGVIICDGVSEAMAAVRAQLVDGAFGDAGSRIVIEEFMEGEEASVFALSDGASYALLLPAQDHKRVGDGDVGPNTGGMGAYAPAPLMTPDLIDRVKREVIEPTLEGMMSEGRPYRGFLYVGLIITKQGPKVVEYNCRLGDPEAQVVVPMIDGDFGDIMVAIANKTLASTPVKQMDGAAVCVVAASAGYPSRYEKGFSISGVDEAEQLGNVTVYHAGTRLEEGKTVTAGGRVLGITAFAKDLETAVARAYEAARLISFEGMRYRRDIALKGLRREGGVL
ncbi:MAG: phosphoribosylamine--glycine ligase [Rhodothermia bacterium]